MKVILHLQVKVQLYNLWISSNKFEQQSIYRGKSGDKVYITLGNYSKENLDYAVVMFSDWNQVAFNNGSNVKYFTSPSFVLFSFSI